MTDREKIDLKGYLEEQFADVKADIAELRVDVGELKADKLKREGRDSFLARAGKISVAAITAFGAAVGAFLGLKNNL